jgi:D-alanyl-D-alanine carboxypeptidase
VSTGAQPVPHRVRRPHGWMAWLLVGLVAAAAVGVVVDRTVGSKEAPATRAGPQRILDGLVTGPDRIAPGVTAYVAGPHGTWLGSAGVANVKTGEPMRPDARMRLDSVSKWWATAVVLQLAQDGRLRLGDTVQRWLPGLLPYGDRITLEQLMTDTSGLIDDNDIFESRSPSAYLARVKDAKLRAQLAALAARLRADPAIEASPLWLIRLAAWQPLLFAPGSRYHHSNIGWNIVGLVAARVGGKPLPLLYRERIFQPLGLKHSAYDPQGPIGGPHAQGYSIDADGTLTDTTAQAPFKGADGAIVSDAADTATFLTGLMGGRLVDRQRLVALWGGGAEERAAAPAAPTRAAALAMPTRPTCWSTVTAAAWPSCCSTAAPPAAATSRPPPPRRSASTAPLRPLGGGTRSAADLLLDELEFGRWVGVCLHGNDQDWPA